MSIESVMPSDHLILCSSLLILPSIFPSNRVFLNESILHITWPKYWSFSFSISPSNEYSGLIPFRMDWFDLYAVPRLPGPNELLGRTCFLYHLHGEAGNKAWKFHEVDANGAKSHQ